MGELDKELSASKILRVPVANTITCVTNEWPPQQEDINVLWFLAEPQRLKLTCGHVGGGVGVVCLVRDLVGRGE